MRSMFVLILLFGVGCGVGGDGGTLEEVSQAALPAPVPGCTPTTITQFQAATQIAAAACESLGDDGNALCMAPIVARYCPDPRACQALVCDEQMETVSRCGTGEESPAACRALFHAAEADTVIGASAARASSSSTVGGPEFYGTRWTWPAYGTVMSYPISLKAGCAINGVTHRVFKASNALTTFTVEIASMTDGNESVVASSVLQANAPGFTTVVLSLPAPHAVQVGKEYQVRVWRTGGPANVDHSFWTGLDADCP